MVPLAHVDAVTQRSLASALTLSYPAYDVLICTPGDDPSAETLAARAIASAPPGLMARHLTGRDRISVNPKLDNLEKAWPAARGPFLLIADSNVVMAPDMITRLLAEWDCGTGLVCSPPLGCEAQSFGAELECAFLNTFQARLQLAADWFGLGFAHGKVMLFHRTLLDPAEGFRSLAIEVAEDCAATKLVRRRGLRVRLVGRLLPQPLGHRSIGETWHRHLRWAQLRRDSFPALFAGEVLATSLLPALAAYGLAHELGWSAPWMAPAASVTLWVAVEAALARAARWPLSPLYPAACVTRDVLATVIWVLAWFRTRYSWRGNRVDMGDVANAATGSADGDARRG